MKGSEVIAGVGLPKDLPLQTQIAFLRRKMVVAGLR